MTRRAALLLFLVLLLDGGARADELPQSLPKTKYLDHFIDRMVERVDVMAEKAPKEDWLYLLDCAKRLKDAAEKETGLQFKEPGPFPRGPMADFMNCPAMFGLSQVKTATDSKNVRLAALSLDLGIPGRESRTIVHSCVVSCGEIRRLGAVQNSIIFAMGDLKGACPIFRGNIVLCDGDIDIGQPGILGSIEDSIVICSGTVRVGLGIEGSVIQAKRVRLPADNHKCKKNAFLNVSDLNIKPSADNAVKQITTSPLGLFSFVGLAALGGVVDDGLVLVRVDKGSALDDAGLRAGDRINGIGSDCPITRKELDRSLRRAGKGAVMYFRRDDELRKTNVSLKSIAP